MEQTYSREDPSFRLRKGTRARGWFCDSCGETRAKHAILVIEERRDRQESPDRVIAVCPDGQVIGAIERLYELAGATIIAKTTNHGKSD